MPLDPETSGLLDADIVMNHKQRSGRAALLHQALSGQLMAISNNLVHQHGAVSDDAGQIAMLQLSAGAPRAGASPNP